MSVALAAPQQSAVVWQRSGVRIAHAGARLRGGGIKAGDVAADRVQHAAVASEHGVAGSAGAERKAAGRKRVSWCDSLQAKHIFLQLKAPTRKLPHMGVKPSLAGAGWSMFSFPSGCMRKSECTPDENKPADVLDGVLPWVARPEGRVALPNASKPRSCLCFALKQGQLQARVCANIGVAKLARCLVGVLFLGATWCLALYC